MVRQVFDRLQEYLLLIGWMLQCPFRLEISRWLVGQNDFIAVPQSLIESRYLFEIIATCTNHQVTGQKGY